IGRQIQEFQTFLQAPKFRGNLGEQILQSLLEQVLPRSQFHLQYRFKDGQVVDAVIITEKGLLPIDAKFPLSHFHKAMSLKSVEDRTKTLRDLARELRRYIDSVSAKYILPDEGTLDFALIYIPSEAIYYELLQQGDLISDYAQRRNILIVSPNGFYYFLKIIMIALEGKRIEAASQRILRAFASIRQDTVKVQESFRVLTSHIVNAKNAIDKVNNEFVQLSNRIEQTRNLDPNSGQN
ncbi:DNA recombination protein RmuC, partial [candidate division KSB1 bacterium]|nr:DNA recombination protein RmuC [candidate division KSB1 bacterium]